MRGPGRKAAVINNSLVRPYSAGPLSRPGLVCLWWVALASTKDPFFPSLECQRWHSHFPGELWSWVPLQDLAVLKLLGRDQSNGMPFSPGPAVCLQTLLKLSHHPAVGVLGQAPWLPQWEGGCSWAEHHFAHSCRPGAGCKAAGQSRAAVQAGSVGMCGPEKE